MKLERNTNKIGLDYQMNGDSVNINIDSMVSKLGDSSISAIRECIDDINSLIIGRQELNKRILGDLDKTEVSINNFLNNMSGEGAKEQMLMFKSKAIEISQAKRQEQLDCWQDVAKLKEELRRHTKELNEKLNRKDMLDSILSD